MWYHWCKNPQLVQKKKKITGAKILNETKAKIIKKHIIRIIHHDQVGFIPCMQGVFSMGKWINVIHYVNNLKDKIHVIISTDTEKGFHGIQHPFMTKILQKVGIKGTFMCLPTCFSHDQLFCNLVDCSQPGSSLHGILQTRILELDCRALFHGIFDSGIKLISLTCLHLQVGSLQLVPPGNSILNIHWKGWCWSVKESRLEKKK